MSDQAGTMVAYICDGYDHCTLEPGCFMRFDPITPTDVICRHTCNPDHAMYTLCDNPGEHPERFSMYRDGNVIKYYERLPSEEL